jgi:CBS domain-containing protein
MLPYKMIEIFTSEEARWQGKPLHAAVVETVRSLKLPARCLVTKAAEGCYESGDLATRGLELLSYNMPLRITIILPAAELDRMLPQIEAMVADGIVAVQDLAVSSHKTRGTLLPPGVRVRDIMTPEPKRVAPDTPLDEVARLLLPSPFTGLPVVDENNRPVGVIAQGDLIYKAGMPMRFGLLAESESRNVEAVLAELAARKAGDVMTQPAVTIEQDQPVVDAVQRMLDRQVKRLPVVDATGSLVGILSRVDVFHAVMRECPDWSSFRAQRIQVENLHCVADIMRRDTHTVLPETPVEEVMRLIDCNDIQRLCVVDRGGRFLGLISDRDLLIGFSRPHPGIWDFFVSRIPFTERGRRHRELSEHLRARTAAEVMKSEVVTIAEDAPIEEALRLMLAKAIKRLPVVDAEGLFKGMISRDSILRTAFAGPSGAG